jgi:hypothetical protein
MFLLVYDSYIGGVPYDISIYTYISPWFGSFPPLSSSFPLPLQKMTSTGFRVPRTYMYRKYLNHIHPSLPSSFSLLLLLRPSS